MPNIIRRFYNDKGEETDAMTATHRAEMVQMENDSILLESIHVTEHKRRAEVFGRLKSGTLYRAKDEKEVADFHTHWSKERK